MSVMDESIQKNQNIFDNLKDEQESNQSKDETTVLHILTSAGILNFPILIIPTQV